MGTRRNILFAPTDRDAFLQACVALEQDSPYSASTVYSAIQNVVPTFQMRGFDQTLSYYDLFVAWHAGAMSLLLSVGNAAHGGPLFLPWHRHYMIKLEEWMQIVLGDPNFGLPYWDWATDGELPTAQQYRTELWSANFLGEARGDVQSGMLGDMRVRLEGRRIIGPAGVELWVESGPARQLEREAGIGIASLPDKSAVASAVDQAEYDVDPYSSGVSSGLRNLLEGWAPVFNPPHTHNRVHVWIGGDMGPSTSPNDPVFFLNHCNVDRIWESWMADNGRDYLPAAGQPPTSHALDAVMYTLLGDSRTPADVLDPSPWYGYDSLDLS